MKFFFKKYSFFFFLILFVFLIFFLWINSFYESFQNSTNYNIILLGDSILNNKSYVPMGQSIPELLQANKSFPFTIYNFAQDNSTISNVYHQLDQIPEYLNSPDSKLFLSIGGNDILTIVIQNDNQNKDNFVKILFKKYEILLKSIQLKMNLSKIYILDIYYPPHSYFQKWIPLLQKWNLLLENNKEQIPVIKISKNLNSLNDFTEFIEPSASGGEKIANSIQTLIL